MRAVPVVFAGLLIQTAASQTSQQAAPQDAESALREGTLAKQHGDIKTAIADFRRAATLKPDSVEAHANLGAALAVVGQLDDAIAEDNLALEANAQNEAVRRNLAKAYFQKGDLNSARLQLEALHTANPSDLQTAILLAYTYNKLNREADAVSVLKPLEPGHENDFQFEYVYAFALIGSGDYADGIPMMEKLAKANKSAPAWLAAGSARFSRTEMNEARNDLDAAVQLDPKLPGAQTMAGQARYAVLDKAGAALAFEAALRQDPMDFVANRDLGAIKLEQGDAGNARPLLELALQMHPTDPLTRMEMAKLEDQAGQYAKAAAILEEVIKADPKWPDPHWVLAQVYSELNRPEDARRERGIAHGLQPKVILP